MDETTENDISTIASNPNPDFPWVREKALDSAIQARIPGAAPDEIVRNAKVFEEYLTGKNNDE